jgi:hypothetical protein
VKKHQIVKKYPLTPIKFAIVSLILAIPIFFIEFFIVFLVGLGCFSGLCPDLMAIAIYYTIAIIQSATFANAFQMPDKKKAIIVSAVVILSMVFIPFIIIYYL